VRAARKRGEHSSAPTATSKFAGFFHAQHYKACERAQ
jgi:hypothetical protein